MPLYNVKKKLNKAAGRLGFADGETVVAACMTVPDGYKRKTAVQAALGSVVSTMPDADPRATGDAAKMPSGKYFVGVTDRRVVVTSVKAVSTNPDEIVTEWPIEAVQSIDVEKGAMASTVTITFVDGTVLRLDGAHSSGAQELHGVLG